MPVLKELYPAEVSLVTKPATGKLFMVIKSADGNTLTPGTPAYFQQLLKNLQTCVSPQAWARIKAIIGNSTGQLQGNVQPQEQQDSGPAPSTSSDQPTEQDLQQAEQIRNQAAANVRNDKSNRLVSKVTKMKKKKNYSKLIKSLYNDYVNNGNSIGGNYAVSIQKAIEVTPGTLLDTVIDLWKISSDSMSSSFNIPDVDDYNRSQILKLASKEFEIEGHDSRTQEPVIYKDTILKCVESSHNGMMIKFSDYLSEAN